MERQTIRQGKEKKCRDQGPRETKSETHFFLLSFWFFFNTGFWVFFLLLLGKGEQVGLGGGGLGMAWRGGEGGGCGLKREGRGKEW